MASQAPDDGKKEANPKSSTDEKKEVNAKPLSDLTKEVVTILLDISIT